MTGTMVAEKGILSMKAEATADTQMMMATMIFASPPETFSIQFAINVRTPVCSRPPTTMKRPMKKSRVL